MQAGVAFVVPEFDSAIIGATYYDLFGELDKLSYVGSVFSGQVANEVTVGYVPHLY